MVSFQLTDEQKDMQELFRKFAQEQVAAAAEEMDENEKMNMGLVQQMQELGYNAATNKYWRGTPVDAVLRAADEYLSDILPKLRDALWNPFAATVKGDARHHLVKQSIEV